MENERIGNFVFNVGRRHCALHCSTTRDAAASIVGIHRIALSGQFNQCDGSAFETPIPQGAGARAMSRDLLKGVIWALPISIALWCVILVVVSGVV